MTLLTQRLADEPGAANLFAARSMFDAARMVGAVSREVMAHDGEQVRPHGDPSATCWAVSCKAVAIGCS